MTCICLILLSAYLNRWVIQLSLSVPSSLWCVGVVGNFNPKNADSVSETERGQTTSQHLPVREILMMRSTACFTTANVVIKPQKHSGYFSNLCCSTHCLGLLSSKPFSHRTSSNLGSRVKLAPFSMPRATHLQASQDAPSPTEESVSSWRHAIGEHDLLIVGPGVLGRLVAQKWQEESPGCQVYGQTMTTDHHNELIQMGINPSLKWTEATHKFPNVIYCAPPSRTPDYAGNVRLAALSWNGEGSFIFTSSSTPYDCSDNGPCDEDNPVVPIGRSPRIDVLLKAENVVLEFGGCVLRLAGLYKADRGAHNYYLGKGIVESRPDHFLNLIHYEDAASLSVAILKKKFRGKIFLGCDNHPLSRQEMMDLVNKSGKFSKKFDKFTGTNDPLGKRLNNSRTCQEVGWEPKYPSFARFLESI